MNDIFTCRFIEIIFRKIWLRKKYSWIQLSYIVVHCQFTATERTDYNITDDYMHIIWAQGQDQGSYVHSPKTGIDVASDVSDKQFYKEDDLKYHGHGDHRGARTFNFFDGNLVGFTKTFSIAKKLTILLFLVMLLIWLQVIGKTPRQQICAITNGGAVRITMTSIVS